MFLQPEFDTHNNNNNNPILPLLCHIPEQAPLTIHRLSQTLQARNMIMSQNPGDNQGLHNLFIFETSKLRQRIGKTCLTLICQTAMHHMPDVYMKE